MVLSVLVALGLEVYLRDGFSVTLFTIVALLSGGIAGFSFVFFLKKFKVSPY